MASGNLLCRFGAAAAQPPATSYATFDVRAGMLVVDYDAAAFEDMDFFDVVPPTYSGGGMTVKLRWMATTATSGTVSFVISGERFQPGVSDIDVYAGSHLIYLPGTCVGPNGTTMVTSGSISTLLGIQVGEWFRLRVTRDGPGTYNPDTMVGDLELVGVEVYET